MKRTEWTLEQALAHRAGEGRKPTFAHPLCSCATTVDACGHSHPAMVRAAACPQARKDCPMHA